jgi:hypothetical protein
VGGGHGSVVPLLLSSAFFFGVFLVAKYLGASAYLGEAICNAMLSAALIWAALGWLVTLSGRGKSLRLAQILVLLQFTSGLVFVATRSSCQTLGTSAFHAGGTS